MLSNLFVSLTFFKKKTLQNIRNGHAACNVLFHVKKTSRHEIPYQPLGVFKHLK